MGIDRRMKLHMKVQVNLLSSKQAKQLLRAATQLAKVLGKEKAEALLILVNALADRKGGLRSKG